MNTLIYILQKIPKKTKYLQYINVHVNTSSSSFLPRVIYQKDQVTNNLSHFDHAEKIFLLDQFPSTHGVLICTLFNTQ